jgi:isopentenyl phosphate kinase
MSSKSNGDVTLVKIGGSSITDKGKFETINKVALSWLVKTIKRAISEDRDMQKRFIIVHGAGSFGHHTAKEYGLKGITSFPSISNSRSYNDTNVVSQENSKDVTLESPLTNNAVDRQKLLGLGRTRISVQKLNRIIVNEFLVHDIPAIGISPCFGIVQETSVGFDENHFSSPEKQQENMRLLVKSTLDAGLIPVLHGDAGMFREHSILSGTVSPAIISGDTIMQMIGTANYVTNAIFITDVDGVFTCDPKANPSSKLIPKLFISALTSSIVMDSTTDSLQATESSHDHDVTGGLKASIISAIEKKTAIL